MSYPSNYYESEVHTPREPRKPFVSTRFEPDTQGATFAGHAEASQAISLKRIADSLERLADTFCAPDSHGRVGFAALAEALAEALAIEEDE